MTQKRQTEGSILQCMALELKNAQKVNTTAIILSFHQFFLFNCKRGREDDSGWSSLLSVSSFSFFFLACFFLLFFVRKQTESSSPAGPRPLSFCVFFFFRFGLLCLFILFLLLFFLNSNRRSWEVDQPEKAIPVLVSGWSTSPLSVLYFFSFHFVMNFCFVFLFSFSNFALKQIERSPPPRGPRCCPDVPNSSFPFPCSELFHKKHVFQGYHAFPQFLKDQGTHLMRAFTVRRVYSHNYFGLDVILGFF